MKFCCYFFALFIAFPAFAAIDVKSPKYAALILDADTGEVFYSRNADAKRYPASLTKMMTLYLTFEALSKGQVAMNTPLKVSKLAASQPQTNISLRTGQTITVQEVMKALVTRSANDAAVVMAESLGGSVSGFAAKMNSKARSLGMKQSHFVNPHGLPDYTQYTSARDMAKLSIALRRDYPQYYDIFKTKSFVWKGVTYASHNRVMGRFDGVDGIKTGFINMSGFNLATSVKRDGYHIVGVVLGGQSGAIRDQHMVDLLDNTFTTLAERQDQPRLFARAPVPTDKPQITVGEAKDTLIKVAEVEPVKKPGARDNSVFFAAKKIDGEMESEKLISTNERSAGVKSAPNTLQYQLASLSRDEVKTTHEQPWGIQVGAFSDERSALLAAANAVKMARSSLENSTVYVTDKGSKDRSIHRARLANLSEYQAKKACQTLSANNTPCFVYRSDSRGNL